MRQLKWALLGSAVAICATPAVAQEAPPAATSSQESSPADQSTSNATVADKSVEAIVVTGRRTIGAGLMKIQTAPEATSSITSAAIAVKQSAGLPLNLIATLPGVNFGSSNPFGLGVRNFLSVRGLDQQQMGWVIEGMPGSDQSQNFPQTQFWADSENVADMTMIAGTTRLHDPVSTASGGEVIQTVRDPGEQFGGMIAVARGSFDSQRYFGRLDSGDLGNGLTAFGSVSYTQGRNFILPEAGNRLHFDLKINKEWGEFGSSKLYVNHTTFTDVRLNSVTLTQFNAAKAADNFLIGNFAETYTPGTTNYYKSALAKYNIWMVSLQNAFALSDNLSLHMTPYYSYRFADAGGMAVLNPTSIFRGNQRVAINPADVVLNPNGTFPVNSMVKDRAHSYGVNSVLQWDPTTSNTLRVGYWFDRYSLYDESRNFIVDAQGNDTGRQLNTTTGLNVSGQQFKLHQIINSFNIADTQTFMDDRLQLNVGVKVQFVKVSGVNYLPGAPTAFNGKQSVVLPRASLLFKPTSDMQIYGNITTNTKPSILKTSYPTNFSITNGAATQVGNGNLPSEYTIGEELGFRYYGAFNFDVALFHMYLKNRQISTSILVNGIITPQVINVGDQSLSGATVEVSTKPIYGFSPYANAQYLSTKQENDQPSGATFLPTKGKDMVQSPKWVANVGLNYDKDGLFGSISMRYVSSQFSTFMNDEKLPAYTVFDANIGYRWESWGGLKEPTVRLNMQNLNKGAYLGTIAGITGNALPTVARNGTTIAARAPNYYLSQPFTIMASISTKF
jgi:iron complex outermembrane receptor protein